MAARNVRTEDTTPDAVEVAVPAAQDDPWAQIEEVSLVEENAPDSRLIDRLKASDAARLAGDDPIGYRIVVANAEVAKSRVAEIRRAGGVKYANCGVGINTKTLDGGRVEVLFKARKRRGSDEDNAPTSGAGVGTASE